MSTTIYLESTTNPGTPSNLTGNWNDQSQVGHFLARPVTKGGSTMTTRTETFTSFSGANQAILIGHWNTPPMVTGQLFENFQTLNWVIRASETSTNNNMFVRCNIAIYASDGVTVRRNLVVGKQDNTEVSTSLLSRADSSQQTGGDYTTQAGDFLSIEIGLRGLPSGTDYSGALSFGSDSATNLSGDGQSAANNPTLILGSNISFLAVASASPSLSPSGSFSPSSSESPSVSTSVSPSVSPSISQSYSQSPSSSVSNSTSPSYSASQSSSVSPSVSPSVAPTTIFYLESTTYAPEIVTPTGWTDTSQFNRYLAETSKNGSAMTTLNITDSSLVQADVIAGQWFSHSLTPGQTISGSQIIGLIIRASETNSSNNLHLSWGVYVYNRTTLKKTIVSKRNVIFEVASGGLSSVEDETTSSTGNYTTIAEDRFVFEIGLEGDPVFGGSHSGSISVGSDSSLDLSTSGISAPNNPILTFSTDTFTFTTLSSSASQSPSSSPSRSSSNSLSPSSSASRSLSPSVSAGPPAVTLNSPSNGSTVFANHATLDFTGTDFESESVEYEVQIGDNSSFAGIITELQPQGNVNKDWQTGDIVGNKIIVGALPGRLWYYNGSSWVEERPDGVDADRNWYFCGMSSTLRMAGYVDTGTNTIKIYLDSGSGWVFQNTLPGFTNSSFFGGVSGNNAIIAVYSTGDVYIYNGSTWTWHDVLSLGYPGGSWNSADIDESGNAIVASAGGSGLWRYNGSTWSQELSGTGGGYWNIVSAKNGRMLAGEQKQSGYGHLWSYSSGTWTEELPWGAGIVADTYALGLSSDGIMMVSTHASTFRLKQKLVGGSWEDANIPTVAANAIYNFISIDGNTVLTSTDGGRLYKKGYTLYLDKFSETDTGFTNPDTPSDTHPFNSGENIQLVTPDLDNGTYYWRVRGKDPSGIWGAWALAKSFILQTSPSQSPSPSLQSSSRSPSFSVSRSISKSASLSASYSVSKSISPSVSKSISPSISPSYSISKSFSLSASKSVSPSPSASISPSRSISSSSSLSPSLSGSISLSRSVSVSLSSSPSTSPSSSASRSPSPSSPITVKYKIFIQAG